MVGVFDDLDGTSKADLEALVGSLSDLGPAPVRRSDRRPKKIRNARKRGFKGFRFEPTYVDGVGLNQTLEVTVRLPAYLVAGARAEPEGLDGFVREAVRDLLVKRGKTWWQPRFMSALKAKEIEAALKRVDRFTSQSRAV